MPSAPTPFPEPVYVARPLLPPLEEFVRELGDIWSAAWLTNNGAKHVALEQALSDHLRAPHLSLFNNGTIALIVACRALRLDRKSTRLNSSHVAISYAVFC